MSLKLQILMALLSCAAVKAQCAAAGLEDGEVKCTSCFGYTACVGTRPTPTVCSDGTACFQNGDTNAVCLTPDVYECVTCPAGSITACDRFDQYQVDACVAGQAPILFQTCDPTLGEICQNGACVVGTTPAPNPDGTPDEQCMDAAATDTVTITYMPECTSGLLCSNGVARSSINCTQGQYFDPVTSQCQSLPVDNCAGLGDIKAPSRTDCTKYVACKGGVEVIEYDCLTGYVYDIDTESCVDPNVDDYQCADLTGCTFDSDETSGSSETTTPESGGSEATTSFSTTSSSTTMPEKCTADNVNERYPVQGDCKSYWACRKTSSNTYAYIKSQCSGILVFNPETALCDLPENVPGCEE